MFLCFMGTWLVVSFLVLFFVCLFLSSGFCLSFFLGGGGLVCCKATKDRRKQDKQKRAGEKLVFQGLGAFRGRVLPEERPNRNSKKVFFFSNPCLFSFLYFCFLSLSLYLSLSLSMSFSFFCFFSLLSLPLLLYFSPSQFSFVAWAQLRLVKAARESKEQKRQKRQKTKKKKNKN